MDSLRVLLSRNALDAEWLSTREEVDDWSWQNNSFIIGNLDSDAAYEVTLEFTPTASDEPVAKGSITFRTLDGESVL